MQEILGAMILQALRNQSRPASQTQVSNGARSFAETLRRESSPDAFSSVVNAITARGGRYVGGADPSKYGIHQSTLKDYDPNATIASNVGDLDARKAEQIYRKIWDRSGSTSVSKQIQAVHFETYIQRPQTARTALQRSGGTLEGYLDARQNLLAPGKKCSTAGCQTARYDTLIKEASSQSQPSGSADGTVQGFEAAVKFVMRHEGAAYVGNDNGKGASKFGILQSTLKEYDPEGKIAKNVSELDETKAKQIYGKIWERSGSDKLAYPLNVIHFDTYVHRPRTAQTALNSSSGDPIKYLESRQTALRGMKSYAKYGRGWEKRIGGLAKLAEETATAQIRQKA